MSNVKGAPELVLCRAPMRISFLGGGSDLPLFVDSTGMSGCVLSATIDRYVWVVAKRRKDSRIVAHYRRIENVSGIEDLQNDYIREVLKLVGWQGGIEIHSMADAGIDRTGLGGSSSFLVALLLVLEQLKGLETDPDLALLAERAFYLETDILGHRIGRQDHWAAAFGGCNQFMFLPGGIVLQERVKMPDRIEDRLLLLYTGTEHEGEKIFVDIHRQENHERNLKLYAVLAELAKKGARCLRRGNFERAFAMIGDSWIAKRGTSSLMSKAYIDAMHDEVIAAGAKCGKLCGTGGGGSMLFWCPQGKQEVLERLQGKYQEMEFHLSQRGVEILLEV